MFLGVQLLDERLCQHVVFFQPWVTLGQLLANHLWLLLPIAHGRQAVFGNATCNEVLHHRLGAPLRQLLVVFLRTFIVAVRAQLDGHVAIFVEQLYQLIERLFGFGTQGGLVKIVEDVVYQHRNGDGGQREL